MRTTQAMSLSRAKLPAPPSRFQGTAAVTPLPPAVAVIAAAVDQRGPLDVFVARLIGRLRHFVGRAFRRHDDAARPRVERRAVGDGGGRTVGWRRWRRGTIGRRRKD